MSKTLFFAACVLLLACGGRENELPYVSLSTPRPQPLLIAEHAEGHPLRIAISAMLSPRRSAEDYAQLVRYIGLKTGMPSEAIFRPSYAETIALLERRDVEAAFMCSGPFIDAQQGFGAEILAVPRIHGASTYRSYIIVKKESPYRTFEQLRGKTFALTDPLSNTGRLFPAYLVIRAGSSMKRYFGRTFFTGGHDNSIDAVAGGLADAAAVDSIIWEKLASAGIGPVIRTRVLLRSEPFGIPPIVVNPQLPHPLKMRLRQAFLEMHRDPLGVKILAHLGFERFVPADNALYDGVRRMKAAVQNTGSAAH